MDKRMKTVRNRQRNPTLLTNKQTKFNYRKTKMCPKKPKGKVPADQDPASRVRGWRILI
jgi:hypothetical protein